MDIIKVKYTTSYTYKWEQTDDQITVLFEIPKDVSYSSYKFELLNDNTCFLGQIEEEIPFFAGLLFDKVKSFKVEQINENSIKLELVKEMPQEWALIFHGPITNTSTIDPFTAFSMGLLCLQNQQTAIQGSQLIGLAASYCFVPALLFSGQVAMQNNNPDSAYKLYQKAAEYGSSDAYISMGLCEIQMDNPMEALESFKKAEELGQINAKVFLGELYSPLSPPRIPCEDATIAVQKFNEVLKINPEHPYALLDLAKHYSKGCGVPKDEKKGLALYKKAKSIDDSVPDIDEYETKSFKKELIIGGIVAIAAIGIGFLLRHLTKKKKSD